MSVHVLLEVEPTAGGGITVNSVDIRDAPTRELAVAIRAWLAALLNPRGKGRYSQRL